MGHFTATPCICIFKKPLRNNKNSYLANSSSFPLQSLPAGHFNLGGKLRVWHDRLDRASFMRQYYSSTHLHLSPQVLKWLAFTLHTKDTVYSFPALLFRELPGKSEASHCRRDPPSDNCNPCEPSNSTLLGKCGSQVSPATCPRMVICCPQRGHRRP